MQIDTSVSVRPAQAITVGRSRLDSYRHHAVDSELRLTSLSPRCQKRTISSLSTFNRRKSRNLLAKPALEIVWVVGVV